jgi:hypothetical protein
MIGDMFVDSEPSVRTSLISNKMSRLRVSVHIYVSFYFCTMITKNITIGPSKSKSSPHLISQKKHVEVSMITIERIGRQKNYYRRKILTVRSN